MLKFFTHSILFASIMLQSGFAQNREVLGEYKIGIVGRDMENSIYQAAYHGALDAAQELSEKYSIDVELLNATPETSRGDSQSASLAKLFIQEADGLIISPDTGDLVTSSIQFALKEGQEVVFFESQLDGIPAMAEILADEEEAGRLAGKAMLKELPTRGRVAILTSKSASPQLEKRLAGIRAALGYRRIEKVVYTEPNYHDAIKVIHAVEEEDRNDLVQGWIFLDDWPLRGMPALPWEPGRVSVVAFQSSPSAFIYTDKGYLDALIVHPYYEWGYKSTMAMVEKLHKNKSPETTTILTQPRIVDWRNMEDYRKNWQTWLR